MKINKSSGFTLLEIIIVVLILGMLATMFIPRINNIIADGRENARRQTVMNACSEVAANSTLEGSFVGDPGGVCPGGGDLSCDEDEATQEITCECAEGDAGVAGGAAAVSAVCRWVN